jgi:hypothetical protein
MNRAGVPAIKGTGTLDRACSGENDGVEGKEQRMAVHRLEIDDTSVLDNIDAGQVEFSGIVDDDEYDFAVQYDLLEALSGDRPDGDAEETFRRFSDEISDAALAALARNRDANPVIVSENDLE